MCTRYPTPSCGVSDLLGKLTSPSEPIGVLLCAPDGERCFEPPYRGDPVIDVRVTTVQVFSECVAMFARQQQPVPRLMGWVIIRADSTRWKLVRVYPESSQRHPLHLKTIIFSLPPPSSSLRRIFPHLNEQFLGTPYPCQGRGRHCPRAIRHRSAGRASCGQVWPTGKWRRRWG